MRKIDKSIVEFKYNNYEYAFFRNHIINLKILKREQYSDPKNFKYNGWELIINTKKSSYELFFSSTEFSKDYKEGMLLARVKCKELYNLCKG